MLIPVDGVPAATVQDGDSKDIGRRSANNGFHFISDSLRFFSWEVWLMDSRWAGRNQQGARRSH